MENTSNFTAETVVEPTPSAILDRQRAAFLREGPPAIDERKKDLARLRELVIENRSAIEEAIAKDFGHRSRHETAILEVVPVIDGISYLMKNLRRFMRAEKRHVAITFKMARGRVEYQPLGVIGIISPWNFPINLSLVPVATALAAGNRVMLKPSELSPHTSELMTTLLATIFDTDQVAVVTGGEDVARTFSSLPFDHLLFTGSTNVGRAVMRAASENLVPVTLELGGKSPAIIAPGGVVAPAMKRFAFGKLTNAGQACVAPDYALVHENDVADFVDHLDRVTCGLYPKGPTSDDYSSIISERHFARLGDLIEDAASKGATVRKIGRNSAQENDRERTLAPTVLLNVSDNMTVMQEEIFGPILPIVPYKTLDEALDFINARPRPLALYWFGPADEDRKRVLAETTSGAVGINSAVIHVGQDDLPFGGIGESGIGAYHGIEGFRRFSHAKAIFDQSRWNAADLARAPFGKLTDLILKFLVR